MRILFLASARSDLEWFRRYYKHVLPAGGAKAKEHYKRTLAMLQRHPFAGHPETGDHRRLKIPRTPFTVIYKVSADRVEVLHIRDSRSNHDDDPSPSGRDPE